MVTLQSSKHLKELELQYPTNLTLNVTPFDLDFRLNPEGGVIKYSEELLWGCGVKVLRKCVQSVQMFFDICPFQKMMTTS